MKRTFFVLLLLAVLVLALAGCASLPYKTADGTEVTYSRFLTSADSIKGVVGQASVEANGQKIDKDTAAALLGAIFK